MKKLTLHSYKDGFIQDQNDAADLIGNADGFGDADHQITIDDDGNWLASEETEEWWTRVIDNEQELIVLLDCSSLTSDQLDNVQNAYGYTDLEYAAINALDELRDITNAG